jgi:hypothetical protein
VILPEELVWSEDWQFNFSNSTVRDRCSKDIMWKSINNTGASRLEVAFPFVNLWPNTKEAYKATFLEVYQVFTVGGSTFCMNHNWVIILMSF